MSDEQEKDFEGWDPEDPDNVLVDVDGSLAQWTLCQAFQWRHLPRPGGLLDQDDAFLHDVGIIARRLEILRKAHETNKARREEAKKRVGLLGKIGRK